MELVADLGLSTLAALHDLNLPAAYCDRIYVLDRGRVVASGPPEAVLQPDLVHEVFGVRAHALRHPATGRPSPSPSPSDDEWSPAPHEAGCVVAGQTDPHNRST